MRSPQMLLIGIRIGINFQDGDMGGLMLILHRLKGQYPGFDSDGGFDFLPERCFIIFKLCGINFNFCIAYNRLMVLGDAISIEVKFIVNVVIIMNKAGKSPDSLFIGLIIFTLFNT